MNQISSNIVKLRALRKANCRELWPLIGLSRCVRVHDGLPSIFVNVAAMINETASTSHWYRYLENMRLACQPDTTFTLDHMCLPGTI